MAINREQRRHLTKIFCKRGFTDEEIEYYFNRKEGQSSIWEGAKVKLDYRWMKFSPDWDKYNKKFKDWLFAHKDDVLTVEFDVKRKEKNPELNFMPVVCFKEDETEPKWLIYAGDLILEPEQEVKKPEFFKSENGFQKELEKFSKEAKIDEAVKLAVKRDKNGNSL